MNLTEFLLARIAEDRVRIFDGIQTRTGGADWRDLRLMEDSQAKRRVVEYAIQCEAEWSRPSGMGEPYATAEHVASSHAVALLAMQYADHPDYDEAWQV